MKRPVIGWNFGLLSNQICELWREFKPIMDIYAVDLPLGHTSLQEFKNLYYSQVCSGSSKLLLAVTMK
jgi:hypothetical protein